MSDAPSANSAPDRRWLVLGVIGIAQLMVVLDLTVMNIALPSAQRALGFTTVDRQWVVTAYTLAFGSLLLPGGRLADLLGRKVTFLAGLAGFAVVSAIGGASVNFAMLITARACQGAFAALLVPSALSLLTTTFTTPRDRLRDSHRRPATRRLGRHVAAEHHLCRRRRLLHHRALRHGPDHRPPRPDRAGAGARLRHGVLVDRRHLRRRRGHRRRPAPPRATAPGEHAAPGTRRSDNCTSQGRPRSSRVMSLAQIPGVREGGDRQTHEGYSRELPSRGP
jgi:Major Facilitator Superfamily